MVSTNIFSFVVVYPSILPPGRLTASQPGNQSWEWKCHWDWDWDWGILDGIGLGGRARARASPSKQRHHRREASPSGCHEICNASKQK